MSTLSDMAEIDQITHWCYILTLPWPWDNTRPWQGHLKVTARSNQLKEAENILFLLFFYNYVHLLWPSDDKVISRSQQGQIIYKKLVRIACFCCFCYNYVHFRLGLTPLWSPTPAPHVLVSMGYNPFGLFFIILWSFEVFWYKSVLGSR